MGVPHFNFCTLSVTPAERGFAQMCENTPNFQRHCQEQKTVFTSRLPGTAY